MLRAHTAYLLLDLKVAFREKLAVMLIVALPAAMYLFFGMMFGEARYGAHSATYYDEYTPSFAALVLLNIALMNIGPTLVIYKELGLFRRLLVTPLDMSAIGIATVVRATLIYLIGYVSMILVGWLLFGRLPSGSILQGILALVICCFGMFSMGYLLGAIFRSTATAFSAAIFIFQPMLLLSGASIPLDQLPVWVGHVSQLIPMTHVVELQRLAWRNELFTTQALGGTLFLVAFGVACAFAARVMLRRTSI